MVITETSINFSKINYARLTICNKNKSCQSYCISLSFLLPTSVIHLVSWTGIKQFLQLLALLPCWEVKCQNRIPFWQTHKFRRWGEYCGCSLSWSHQCFWQGLLWSCCQAQPFSVRVFFGTFEKGPHTESCEKGSPKDLWGVLVTESMKYPSSMSLALCAGSLLFSWLFQNRTIGILPASHPVFFFIGSVTLPVFDWKLPNCSNFACCLSSNYWYRHPACFPLKACHDCSLTW